jgi:hypothetical protein
MQNVQTEPSINFQPRKPIRYKPRVAAPVAAPPPPVVPAVVTSAFAIGNEAHLYFGQPLELSGAPLDPDGSVTFDGVTPSTVSRPSAYELAFTCPNSLTMGSTWAIHAQPAGLATALAVPQAGTF